VAVVVLCCTGLVIVVLRFPASVTVPVEDWAKLIAPLLAAAACTAAGLRRGGRTRAAWWLVGASAVCWGAGQGARTYFELGLHQNPFPFLADAGFVASVPLLVAGLFTLPVWASGAPAKVRAVSDGLLVAAGLLLVSWNIVLAPLVANPAATALARGVTLAHPVCDVIVVALLAIVWSRGSAGARGPILVIIAGLGLLAASDSALAHQGAQSSFLVGQVIDVGWVAGYLVVGLGALFSLNRPVRPTTTAVPRWPLATLPYLAVPLVLGFALQERIVTGRITTFTLSLALAVFLIVLLRQGLAARESVGRLHRLARNQSELSHRAEHDLLTDLLNRASFIRFMEDRLSEPVPDRLSALMVVDLDDFKEINDSLGHSGGDEAITAVARRLQSHVPDGDLLARLGGDEFGLFLTTLHDRDELVAVAERIAEVLKEPYETSGRRASVSATIGVATAGRGDLVDDLLRRADVAVDAAKARGKGRLRIFEPTMNVARYAPVERHPELERAIADGELSLSFQPLLEVASRRILGVQALVRWEHPRLGAIGPAGFLDHIDNGGLMTEAGAWVVEEACRQVARLREATGDDIFACVTLSGSQVERDGFVTMVAQALSATGLPASALVVELRESGRLGESPVVGPRLRALRDSGVRVAISDVGSASSFTHLRTPGADILTIDRSFVDDLRRGGPGTALVKGMIALGSSLGLVTLGEGVEGEEQHRALAGLGCDMAQGPLYAPPMAMDELLELHAQHRPTVERTAAVAPPAGLAPAG